MRLHCFKNGFLSQNNQKLTKAREKARAKTWARARVMAEARALFVYG
jgi:hypothetical protein